MRLHFSVATAGAAIAMVIAPWPIFSQTVANSASPEVESNSLPGTLQEITVTAERRRENVQDVPIDIAVVTAEDILKANITDSMDLQVKVPGLETSHQITGATIYMRGVGTQAGPGNENAVATYVDDVYINGFSGTNVPLFNLDHVEVLKGPQGTLFGRNATGGVINIVTKDPSDTPSMDIRAGYGNYNTYAANVYGTTGILPTVAADVSLDYRNQRDGFGHDVVTGQKIYLGEQYGARSKIKWQPDGRTSVVVSAEFHYDNTDLGLNPNVVPGTLSIGGGTYAGPFGAQVDNSISGGADTHGTHENAESIVAKHDFDWASIKSISAARLVTDRTTYDQDLGPAHVVDALFNSRLQMYTEELHLTSSPGFAVADHELHWLVGAFFMSMTDAMRPLAIAGAAVAPLARFNATSTSHTQSYAAFWDATLAVTSRDNLTLGARFSDDRIINRSNDEFVAVGGGSAFLRYPSMYSYAKRPTFRAVWDHKITDEVMLYGSASSGYKSGVFNLFAAGTPAVRPETIDAFAIGLKSIWLDRRLQANFESFYYKYLNQQVDIIRNGSAFTINAAQSRIYGIDTSFTGRIASDFVLGLNIEYLHGRYSRFANAPIVLQEPATCDPAPMRLPGPLLPGGLTCAFDAAGKPTTRSPSFSGNLSADYYIHTDLGTIDLNENYYYTTSYNWDPSGQYPEHAYGLLSTAADWTSISRKWSVGIYCSNCLNRYHDTFIAEGATGMQRAAEQPRQYGIQFTVRLGE